MANLYVITGRQPCTLAAIAEVHPRMWSGSFAREDRTADQHDAYSVADHDGTLPGFLNPVTLDTSFRVGTADANEQRINRHAVAGHTGVRSEQAA